MVLYLGEIFWVLYHQVEMLFLAIGPSLYIYDIRGVISIHVKLLVHLQFEIWFWCFKASWRKGVKLYPGISTLDGGWF